MVKNWKAIPRPKTKALLVIDENPLKRIQIKSIEKYLGSIKTVEEKRKHFSSEDLALYEAWHKTTFKDLLNEIEDLRNKNNELSVRWNQIYGLSRQQKILLEDAYLQFLREENLLKNGTDNEKSQTQKIRNERQSWIDRQIEEDIRQESRNGVFQDDFKDLFRDIFGDDFSDELFSELDAEGDLIFDNTHKGRSKQSGSEASDTNYQNHPSKKGHQQDEENDPFENEKELYFEDREELVEDFGEEWDTPISKVNWRNQRQTRDLLRMWFLRGFHFAEWDLFDSAYLKVSHGVRKKFRAEIEMIENRDFDTAIKQIRENSLQEAMKFGAMPKTVPPVKDSDQNTELRVAEDVQLKTLYRQLVGRLHPDRLDPKTIKFNWDELWSKVQSAYQHKNILKLRELVLLTTYWEDPFLLGVSDLETLNNYLGQEAESIKISTEHLSKHPAWGFSKKKSFRALQRHQSAILENELTQWVHQVQTLDYRFIDLESSIKRRVTRKTGVGRRNKKKEPSQSKNG